MRNKTFKTVKKIVSTGPFIKGVRSQGEGGLPTAHKWDGGRGSSDAVVQAFCCKFLRFLSLWCVGMEKRRGWGSADKERGLFFRFGRTSSMDGFTQTRNISDPFYKCCNKACFDL